LALFGKSKKKSEERAIEPVVTADSALSSDVTDPAIIAAITAALAIVMDTAAGIRIRSVRRIPRQSPWNQDGRAGVLEEN